MIAKREWIFNEKRFFFFEKNLNKSYVDSASCLHRQKLVEQMDVWSTKQKYI